MNGKIIATLVITGIFACGQIALAEEPVQLVLTLKDHHFSPKELRVPAGKPFVITVKNMDSTVEEFEIDSLNIEKIAAGNSVIKIKRAGVKAGAYEFKGEFNEDVAKGVLIVE